MIKIIAIAAFIVVGAWVVFGARPDGVGFANYVNNGGFFPNGLWGPGWA